MTLPKSLSGYHTLEQMVRKLRRVMIGAEGKWDTGKTEFALSAPAPIVVICLDRGFEALLDNPAPPVTRQKDVVFRVIEAPAATAAKQEDYLEYWRKFRTEVYTALNNPDVKTVVIDGDSDSWELQRLAEFGKLTQIPSHLYSGVNAARRAFYARCFDSHKNVIATNKIKKEYIEARDANGNVIIGDNGQPKRVWSGEWERQGFADQDYLWQVQLVHQYDPEKGYGIRITKCKANREVEGEELWGDECNFLSLVSLCYPHITEKEWGL